MTQPASGEKAPEFDLQADDGEAVSLAAFKGRKLVLYFYPKDDTQTCTVEAIEFSARLRDFEAAGTSVVGVSPDSVAKHGRFRKKHDLTIRLAADPDRQAIEAYGVWQEKSMYGRKYMGVVRTTFLIDAEGRIARVWPNVRIAGHVDEVLAEARRI